MVFSKAMKDMPNLVNTSKISNKNGIKLIWPSFNPCMPFLQETSTQLQLTLKTILCGFHPHGPSALLAVRHNVAWLCAVPSSLELCGTIYVVHNGWQS